MEDAIEQKRKRDRSRRADKKRRQRVRAEEQGKCFKCCTRRAGYGADSRYCSICSSGSDLFSARRHQMHNVLPRTREDVIVISDTEVESIDQQLEQMLGHATHSNWLPMDSYVSEFPSRQAPDTGSTPITEDRHLRASVAEFGNARNRGPDSGSTSI